MIIKIAPKIVGNLPGGHDPTLEADHDVVVLSVSDD